MISQSAFKDGIELLLIEFDSKGFVMSDKRLKQWYIIMKDQFTDEKYKKVIRYVLETVNRNPSMADIMIALEKISYPDSHIG